MPGKTVTAGHLPDRHGPHITDQLAGQATGDMGSPAQEDLGMVLPMTLAAFTASETAPHPLELGGPAPSRKVPDLQTTDVVHPGRLEPTMRTANHPAHIDDLHHQPLDQIHHHADHAESPQVKTNRHSIRTHQSPFLARRLASPSIEGL